MHGGGGLTSLFARVFARIEDEVVKPYLARFTCGFAEILFDLDFEGKPITRGNYSEIREYIDGE